MNHPATAPFNEKAFGEQLSSQHHEMVARAIALQPLLAKNAPQTEKNRRLCEENVQALAEAGLFNLTVPKRYSGAECLSRTIVDVLAALAEGCGSTAWVAYVINNTNWQIALGNKQTQDEVFGANPNVRVAGVFSPTNEVERVDGGVKISGKWFYCSGCYHADWLTLGLVEQSTGGTPIQYMALVPISDVTIEDTWFVAGLEGTGSNCAVAKNIFIPEHRLVAASDIFTGNYPTEFKDDFISRASFMSVSSLCTASTMLGLGRAAVNFVIDKASQRGITYTTFMKQNESTAFQLAVAKAEQKIDMAYLLAYRAAENIDTAALNGEQLDPITKSRIRANCGMMAQLVTEAIDTCLTAHGSSGFADVSPLQRIWRDANMAARHAFVLQPVGDEVYGKRLLGVENTTAPML